MIRSLVVRNRWCHCSSQQTNDHVIGKKCHMFGYIYVLSWVNLFRTNDKHGVAKKHAEHVQNVPCKTQPQKRCMCQYCKY